MSFNQGAVPYSCRDMGEWITNILMGLIFLFLIGTLCVVDWVAQEPVVYLAIFSYMLHRLAVGCKYGLMDDLVYHHLCTTLQKGGNRRPTDLLPTWTNPSSLTIKRALEQSAARVNTEALTTQILLPVDHLARLEQLNPKMMEATLDPTCSGDKETTIGTSSTASVTSDGKEEAQEFFKRQNTGRADYQQKQEFASVSVGKLASVIVNDIMGGRWWHVNTWAGVVIAMLTFLIPQVVGLALTGQFLPSGMAQDHVLYGLVAFSATMLCGIGAPLHCFVLIGALDSYRRNAIYTMLDVMLEPHPAPVTLFHLKELGFRQAPVFVDLSITSNIPAWWALRELMQDLGKEYQKRASLYSAFAAMLAAALMGFLLARLFIARTLRALTVYDYKLVALAGWVFLCMFLEIMLIAYFGGRANQQTTTQRFRIKRIQFALEQELDLAKTEVAKTPYELRLKRSIKMLSSTEALLTFLDLTRPIKFLGFRADMTLVKLLFTSGSALMGLTASLLSHNG